MKKYEEIWKLAVANMTSKDNIAIIHYSLTTHHILKQFNFDNYVLVKTTVPTQSLETRRVFFPVLTRRLTGQRVFSFFAITLVRVIAKEN